MEWATLTAMRLVFLYYQASPHHQGASISMYLTSSFLDAMGFEKGFEGVPIVLPGIFFLC